MKFEDLIPGNYSIIVIVEWQEIDYREYTVTINSADDISITNILGESESVNLKITEDTRTVMIPDIMKSVKFEVPTKTLKYAQLTQSQMQVDLSSTPIASML